MKQTLNFVIFLVIAFSYNACNGDDTNPMQDQKEVTGSVTDENGNTYPNTKIKIFNASEEIEGITNSSGIYGFDLINNGAYKVTIIPPLSSSTITEDTIGVEVQIDVEKTVDFIIQLQPLEALVVIDDIDIYGEIRNEAGVAPSESDEEIYARNVFDPPIGMLTPIKAPNGHHLTLSEWTTAIGNVEVNCNGNSSKVDISLQGLIPNGTYTFWLNFLNKKKIPGQPVNLGNDVVKIDPLGSGTLNVRLADDTGNITTTINHSSCILTEENALVLVVVYHINGNTFGSEHIPDEEDVSHLLIYFQ